MSNHTPSSDVSKVLIVCPIYWDAASFLELRERIINAFEGGFDSAHLRFFVVDDSAGADRSTHPLANLPDVDLLVTPFNVGHQRAIVFGLRELVGELDERAVVVTMDSDGEDRPEDLPRLLNPLFEDESGRLLSVAQRTKRKESAGFKISYRLFRGFFRLMTGEVVQSGNFAAMRGGLLKQIIRHPYFDISYSATLIGLPLQRVLVPCERGERYEGNSKMNPRRLIGHGLGMLVPFTDRIAVRGFVTFSVLASLASAAILVILAGGLLGAFSIVGWPLFTSLGLLVLSLFGFGNVALLFASFSQTRALSFSDPGIMHPDA